MYIQYKVQRLQPTPSYQGKERGRGGWIEGKEEEGARRAARKREGWDGERVEKRRGEAGVGR